MSNILNTIKSIIYVIFCIFFYSPAIALSSDWVLSETSKVRIISPYSQYNDKTLIVGLEYQMEPGWKTYWKSPGDGGFPQKISWQNSFNVQNVNILWPTPEKFEILGLTSLGYENNVIFPLEVEIEDKSQNTFLDLQLNYLICKEVCIPGEARLFLDIPSGKKIVNENYYNLEKAFSLTPQKDLNSSYIKNIDANVFTDNKISTIQIKFESKKSFFNPKIFIHTPFGLPVVKNTISYSSNNKFIKTNFNFDKKLISKNTFPLEVIIKDKNHNFKSVVDLSINEELLVTSNNHNLIYFILISFLAGLILNVMPCVLPILSIKLMTIFSTDEKQARISFLITAFGIIASFVFLGLIFLILQYLNISIAWGMQFQQPYFLIFITLIMFLFMMNMFGQFEISLPEKLTNLPLFRVGNYIFLKDFLNGFFATLMATPCSAPFVGTAITAAFTQTASIGMSIFLFMGIGMSLPYLMIASYPKLIRFLPKSGKWMIYVKYFLGLLLFATIVWLSNILLNYFNYYFLILSFILILLISYRQKIPFIKNIITLISVLIIFSSSSLNFFQQKLSNQNNKDWINFFEVDIDKLLEEDSIVFLDITADWCATCQFNKINVLDSKKIINLFKDNDILLLRADWTKPNEEINKFLGKYDRFGIPFNAFFSKKYSNGILLSELLSEQEIVNAIDKLKQ